jgi:GTPase SAR1 family protein
MEQLEQQLEEMVDSFLNINLYGTSGCGKTSLIKRVLKNKSKIFVKFNLSDFYSKKNIFYLISKSINKYLNSKTNKINNHIENINKWYDLYQTFEDSKDFSFFKIYFIIDSILDIDSFNYYKKELIKLFVTISSYKNMKIILISNFDITNSEIQYDYDFSSFISIQFPVLTNDELKKNY